MLTIVGGIREVGLRVSFSLPVDLLSRNENIVGVDAGVLSYFFPLRGMMDALPFKALQILRSSAIKCPGVLVQTRPR